MIYDCFTFFNEFELLEIRLHELDPYVDKFVLVESGQTFRGDSKPFLFEERKEEFREFLPKIIHLISPPAKDAKNAWDREKHQRDWIMKGLEGCSPDDRILIGDADEIVRGSMVGPLFKFCKADPEKWFAPALQTPYFYFVNLQGDRTWPGTVMVTYENIFKHGYGSPHFIRLKRRHGYRVRDAGWHFASMGGIERAILKYQSYSHWTTVSRDLLDPEKLKIRMTPEFREKGWPNPTNKVEIDFTFPKWLVDNQEKFSNLIYRGEARGSGDAEPVEKCERGTL